jgi:F-type H+-transporting ATPase subunit epsilon
MFKLSAVTPEKVVFEQDAVSIIAPGIEGYLGVLTNHAPLITPLTAGRLDIKDSNGKELEYFIAGGFLEVSKNVATILADAIEKPEDIDIDRARQAEARARDRLSHRTDPKIDVARAEVALKRAIWRQKMAGR